MQEYLHMVLNSDGCIYSMQPVLTNCCVCWCALKQCFVLTWAYSGFHVPWPISATLRFVETLKERKERALVCRHPGMCFAYSHTVCLPLCLFLLLSPELDAVCRGTYVWIMLDSSETM